MPRPRLATQRCAYCPAANKKKTNNDTLLMRPLFLDEALDWPPSDLRTQHQVRALREAIAPYLCIAELRRLAASGENIQAALRGMEPVPEEVQALICLLQMLLTPMKDERITQPGDLAALLMLEMGHLDHEELWVVCLDNKNHVQRLHRLYRGSLDSSVIRVCELFRLPLVLNSASIIVAHNHPSGVIQPSTEDIAVTRSLIQAGELMQIEVLDHLIIGQGRWISMREQRLGW
ncbi:MAG: RadC family protein [Ktedonobacteraceae bacterium]